MSPLNLYGWENVEIVKQIEAHYGVPAHLQNDANACAVAELKSGAGRGTENLVFMTFGAGLGAGLILNGKLYSGTNDNAGEISDWTLPIYACNDTLEEKSSSFTVKDAETDEILIKRDFKVGINRTELITRLPVYYSDHKLLIIEWSTGSDNGFNHYLCGYPPFNLEKYRYLMKKCGL